MTKLTKPQGILLIDMSHAPSGKSGGYWCDLGSSMVTLYALERKGFVVAHTGGYTKPRQWRWTITEAGLSALNRWGYK